MHCQLSQEAIPSSGITEMDGKGSRTVEVNSLDNFQVTAEMPCDTTAFSQLCYGFSQHQTNSPCLKMSPYCPCERTRSRTTRFHFNDLEKSGEQDGRTVFKNTQTS